MKTAVVSGATGGIGSAIAHRLAKDGLAVVVGYHTAAERAVQLLEDVPGSGHRAAHISVLDLASPEELAESLRADVGSLAAAETGVVGDLPFTTGSIITVDGGRPLGIS